MVKLLALDTSTTSTGCAVYKDGKLSRSLCIKMSDKDSGERIRKMIRGIYELIKTENPDIVVIETPSSVRNAKTQRELTALYGAVLGKCAEKELFFYDFRPSEWRKIVKDEDEVLPRKRSELKDWAVSRIKDIYGKETVDDEAEAILIGQAYINKYV